MTAFVLTDLTLPIWILAVASILRLAFGLWQEWSIRKSATADRTRQDQYDAEYERSQTEHEIQQEQSRQLLQVLSNKQTELVDSYTRHEREWRALVELQTGKKLAEMTDAEIIHLVRADETGEPDAT